MPASTAPIPPRVPRLVAMISGAGRTILNILDQIERGQLRAQLVAVIASRPCEGADKLAARGVPVDTIPGEIAAMDLQRAFESHRADWIVLGGYLKYIHVPPHYRARMVNIHPSLLPRHGGRGMYGLRVHQAVLATGDSISGCTVHLVDDQFDHGAIVLQRSCPVLPGDTPETLGARVMEQELIAFPEALRILIA
jgi:phosphoribosylglycinamide formyltransferase 1